MNFTTLQPLIGVTLVEIQNAQAGSDRVTLHASDGRRWLLYHQRDCCESVRVEQIDGDVDDMLGSPLVMAEEVEEKRSAERGEDGETWTFYKFATAKGYVTFRWCGQSNGYYSESVTFEEES